jgi:predicted nucleic acid-binding protein
MIVLDSNVLSEMLRPAPDAGVMRWVEAHSASQLFTTAVTEAEIRYGVARLESGQRKSALASAVDGIFLEDMAGRVLPFDGEAAVAYAAIVADRESHGRPISQFDAQIAAIARIHGADVATRNVRDFEGCGVGVIDPWAARP